MNLFLAVAAGISFVGFLAHLFLGGRDVARPLLAAQDIAPVPKYTNYFCWHIVSIILIAMPAGFLLGAFDPGAHDLAAMMTFLAAAFVIWNAALVIWKRQKWLEFPQWTLFVPITMAGVVGLWQ